MDMTDPNNPLYNETVQQTGTDPVGEASVVSGAQQLSDMATPPPPPDPGHEAPTGN